MTMDTVFVLLKNLPFEGGAVIGVFSTKEKANQYCEQNPLDEDYEDIFDWLIEEHTLDELCGGEG